MTGELINGRDIEWDWCAPADEVKAMEKRMAEAGMRVVKAAPESIEQEFGRERGVSVALDVLAAEARRVRDVLQRATTRRLG